MDDLKVGDCIVSFSKKQIYQLREEVNLFMNTNEHGELISEHNHCAIIYGSLPPETKIIQQTAFNERSGNIKFLIATDAIGMGMNLNINRVIFATLWKHSRLRKRHQIEPS